MDSHQLTPDLAWPDFSIGIWGIASRSVSCSRIKNKLGTFGADEEKFSLAESRIRSCIGVKRKTYFGQAAVSTLEYVVSAGVGAGLLSEFLRSRNADKSAGREYQLEQA